MLVTTYFLRLMFFKNDSTRPVVTIPPSTDEISNGMILSSVTFSFSKCDMWRRGVVCVCVSCTYCYKVRRILSRPCYSKPEILFDYDNEETKYKFSLCWSLN